MRRKSRRAPAQPDARFSMDEFALIRRYFANGGAARDDVVLGIGDDAAVLRVPDGHELVVSTDNLVADIHFPATLDADAVGYRALAVNLSDLAAMGAEPAWALLAITLPEADESWLERFSRGFFRLASQFDVALVGGNVARGPLNIAVTAHGLVPAGTALKRTGAQPGDAVFVTGHPGDAAAGLRLIQSGHPDMHHACVQRFCFPEPRVTAGVALRGIASSAIDISDGLLADLSHLLEGGKLGARLELADLPLSAEILQTEALDSARQHALSGGDDYELCFTVPQHRLPQLDAAVARFGCTVTRIGIVDAHPGLRLRDAHGEVHGVSAAGHRHFI